MIIRATSIAPGYVRKFQRAFVASAIVTLLGACAGSTGEETGNGAASGTTPDIGAAVEASVATDTDLVVTGNGSGVEVTPDVDSTDIDTVVDVSEGLQTEVEVDSTTDTVEIPEVDSNNSIPDNALGLIQSHPELGLFATAIQSSGLVSYLADPEQRVTVFALSDKAFQSLSSIQRDALFIDETRLNKLVRATTIHDTRITESAAGVVGNMQALANNTLIFERNGDLITVAGEVCCSIPSAAVEVTDTLLIDNAAIHIIDDFVNIDATFFPPDPGSIMERLLTDEASTISNVIRYTRWYRELGNSEGEWTVFLPIFSVNSNDIEPYIVAGTVNDPIIGESGAFTSVDGSSHVIENVDGELTIDDIDITEINALQVNNGHVHHIAWPFSENANDYSSVYDTIFQSTEHTYLTMLINRANLADILDDPYGDYTIFAPNDAAFAALESAAPGALESMSPDELVRVLQYHVVAGTYDSAALSELISSSSFTYATRESLVIDGLLTFTATEGQGIAVNDVAIIGADLLPVVAEGETTAGIVHSIGAVLTPSAVYPDYDSDGIPDVVDPDADGDGLDDLSGQDNFVDLNGDGLDDITLQTEAEADAGTVIEVSAQFPCGSERGTDNASVNDAWNDNCVVKRPSNGGQFADSLFTVGIQRVLFCSGFGTETETDYTVFADGEFGPVSEAATIAFQQAESLTADGIVEPQTWARLQERIELLATGTPNQTPDTYGFTDGVCAGIPMFYQDISWGDNGVSLVVSGWTLARNQPNEAETVPFSYEMPFGRL